MAQLTKAQLAALDTLIAHKTADKVEASAITPDFTHALVAVVHAVAPAVDLVLEGAADAAGGDVASRLSADDLAQLREQLGGKPPTLEDLVALRSHHA